MSSQLAGVASPAETRPAVSEQPATAEKSHAPSQFKMARLIRELEGLLLLEGAEPYCKLWQELKLEVSKPLEVIRVTADNAHIAELTNAVKAMVSKQKQQTAAPMGANTYAAALRFGAAAAATGSPPVREVPTRLAREIVIRCPNATPEDRTRPIARLVEEINKKKSQEVSGKVLAARRLPSGDVVITTNTEKAKEQLEQDSSWLAAVGKEAQVNRRRFPVMVHGMRVAALDCTKQKEAIQQLAKNTGTLHESAAKIRSAASVQLQDTMTTAAPSETSQTGTAARTVEDLTRLGPPGARRGRNRLRKPDWPTQPGRADMRVRLLCQLDWIRTPGEAFPRHS